MRKSQQIFEDLSMKINSVNLSLNTRKSTFGMAQMTPEVEEHIKRGIATCNERKDTATLNQIAQDLKWIAENEKDSIIFVNNGILTPLDYMFGNSYYIRKKGLANKLFGPKAKIAEMNLFTTDYTKLPASIRRGMESLQTAKAEKE